MEETQAYQDLPEGVVTEVERLNTSASNLTIGMIVSLFFPAGFLFVFAFAIARIVQSKALLRRHPELSDPIAIFPGKTKAEVKRVAESNSNLTKVLEFSQARKGFWVVIFAPLIIVGICVGLFMMLT
jgi:uncharacterized integral membrane protein